MKAMIMAAGVGNRLMPLTLRVPKPMVPIANIPIMRYGVELLRHHNITSIVANLHYLPNKIMEYFDNGEKFGVNLRYSPEKKLMGTAGGVKKNEAFLSDSTFVILSGDGLTDIDLTELIAFHKSKGSIATLALKSVEEVSKFGVVITDEDGRIKAFQEKPSPEEALSNLINTGIYVFEPKIFGLIPEDVEYDFGKQLFPKLVELGLPFYGYKCEGNYWCDVGDAHTYLQANVDVISDKVNTTLKYESMGHHCQIGKDVKIDKESVIGENCIIEDGVSITNSVIWDNTVIKKSAKINRSLIANNCLIQENNTIEEAIVVDCKL